ncbi:elongin-C-like [Teleopsis dalmanni]|uniref:elongin-C-like n=1 Tax=Teleopsis dalmanni TaxID=139649 RepID=UPI0018CF2138|nr:elongin-C-like [Teleopsis dalmanni]
MEANAEVAPTPAAAEPAATEPAAAAPAVTEPATAEPAAAEAEAEAAPAPRLTPVPEPEPVPIVIPKIYRGIEGPNAPYLKIVSGDGHSFIILKEYALISGTIKAMLAGPRPFREREPHEIRFREIQSHIMQKVCIYFQYKINYENSMTDVPDFPLEPEIAVDLLMASNFLNC